MCLNYEFVIDNDWLLVSFGVILLEGVDVVCYCSVGVMVLFICCVEMKFVDVLGDVWFGVQGLLLYFVIDIGFVRGSYDCFIEIMKFKLVYCESWWVGWCCVILVKLILVWNFELGWLQMWYIQWVDEELLVLVGLWSEWISLVGEKVLLFSMLIINVDEYEIFGCMGVLGYEK